MAEMKGDEFDGLIDAVAKLMSLPIDPAWKPAIKSNLQVSLRLAAHVEEFELPDEAEPAPVFEA